MVERKQGNELASLMRYTLKGMCWVNGYAYELETPTASIREVTVCVDDLFNLEYLEVPKGQISRVVKWSA